MRLFYCYLWKQRENKCSEGQSLLVVGAFAYVAFFIVLTMTYRSFEVMKAIFLFPALLCTCYLLIDGMNYIYSKVQGKDKLVFLLDTFMVSLVVFYYVDLVILTYHLT